MARRPILLGLTTLLLACGSSSATALASSADSGATLSYLRANDALVRVAHANLSSSTAGYRGVLSNVRRSCPRAAAKAPQDPESTQLSNEVIGAMVLASAKPDLGAIASYLRATNGLRWSSSTVTREVSSYRTMLGKLVKLTAPDICGDIAAWSSSGWTKLAPSTLSFDRVFYPNWVALGLLPPGLARFESGEARQLAGSASKLEYVLTNAEAKAVETWSEIMDELELSP